MTKQLKAKEVLEETKLFLFAPEDELIFEWVRYTLSVSQRWKDKGIEVPPELIEMLYIAAAKFAVLRQAYIPEFPSIEFPIKVISTDADLAMQKYDTLLSDPCLLVKRLSECKVSPEDVFLFSGDLLKFEEIAVRENWDTDEKKIEAIAMPQQYLPTFVENIQVPFKEFLLRHIYRSPFLWLEALLSKLQVDIAKKKEKGKISEEVNVAIKEMKSKCGAFIKFLE
ncbi:hypothetical protein LR013_03425 [candidate division NPL-UPA2 bacterium]|nr:hypothetical protein [candidate division NPL-UPA2 bacterium]